MARTTLVAAPNTVQITLAEVRHAAAVPSTARITSVEARHMLPRTTSAGPRAVAAPATSEEEPRTEAALAVPRMVAEVRHMPHPRRARVAAVIPATGVAAGDPKVTAKRY